MVPRLFTRSEWLATLLRRSARKGYVPNVSLAEDCAILHVGLPTGESAVALVRTPDGREYLFTSLRVIEHGLTLLHHDDVKSCHWITNDPDPREKARLKSTQFDRLLLELSDDRIVVLERMGQAAFPLLRFFGSIATERTDA